MQNDKMLPSFPAEAFQYNVHCFQNRLYQKVSAKVKVKACFCLNY